MDLFPTIRKTGEFVISKILTVLQKKVEGDIPRVGVISTGTAGFARMEGSSEVASSVLNNFPPTRRRSPPSSCFTIELHSGDNQGL